MTPSSSFHRAAGDRGEHPAPEPDVAGRPGISAAPIDMAGLLAGAHHPGAGAVVLFSGEVRDSNHGREVAYLEYESHVPLATKMIADILQAARDKWDLKMAIAQHRI